MKYRMLWIDDSPAWAGTMMETVQAYLHELGLDLVADLLQDGSQVLEYLATKDVDLIAVDYKLTGKNGDKIIDEIRASHKYTEILFYTADPEYRTKLPCHDGVYRAHRPDVDAKVKKLIDLTLKRVQSPANMRGVVIAETTDLEAMIEDLLITQFGDKGPLFRCRVLDKGVYDFAKKYAFLLGLIKDRIAMLSKEVSNGSEQRQAAQLQLDKLQPLQNTLKDFLREVIDTRNLLAHVKEQLDENGKAVLKSTVIKDTITIDHTWCVTVRKNLSKHHKALLALKDITLG